MGIKVTWGLGVGSTYSGTAGSWASANYFSATGATSIVGTNGATFYITGVQLEVGSSATGFEYVNYQTSLANCQRYFQLYGNLSTPASNTMLGSAMATSTTGGAAVIGLVQEMRTAPTLTFSSTASAFRVVSANDTSQALSSVPTGNLVGNKCVRIAISGATGLVAGNSSILFGDTTAAAWIGASSEL